MHGALRTFFGAIPPLTVARQKIMLGRDRWQQQRIIKHHRLPLYRSSPEQKLYSEIACIDLLRRVQDSDDALRAPVYPVGGAAGYGLLYLLARALAEYDFNAVIEFGVGQSTALLDRYAATHDVPVLSVEEDESWVNHVRQEVMAPSHQVLAAPLIDCSSASWGNYRWYNLEFESEALSGRKFDLFLVDGPIGTRNYSRIGIVEAFERLCAVEFLVIWDDVDRIGDLQSFAQFMCHTKARGQSVGCAFLVGMKTVALAYTPRFQAVQYYV